MTSICRRCGGYVIGDRAPDYYRARRWRCINCGWYREDAVIKTALLSLHAVRAGGYRSYVEPKQRGRKGVWI